MSNFNMFTRGGGYGQSVGVTPQQQLWQQHIQSLRTIGAREISATVYETDVHLRSGQVFRLKITLPGGFPASPPAIEVLPPCQHNWIDRQMQVIGCEAINNWNMHRNLGDAINTIRAELYNHPPVMNQNNFGGDSGGPARVDHGQGSGGDAGQVQSGTTDVPRMPIEFPELDAMSNEQLQEIANTDEAFVTFFNSLPHVVKLEKVEKELREENLRLAQANLDQEPVLAGLKQTLIEKHELLAVQKREYDDLVDKQRQLAEKFTPQAIASQLEEACKASEKEAQSLAQDFQSGKETDVDSFIERYKAASMQYHMRKIKTRKLAELTR
eukprot:m.996476 g.996476  ORF g.996476 m.996476 type:complete len:326 (+) comp24019_c0_seq42:228-1205(+)